MTRSSTSPRGSDQRPARPSWLTGEASELGITATDREVAAELETVKDQQFKTEAEFNKYLKEANFTLEGSHLQDQLQLLDQKIQDKITKSVSSVPDSDIENYYEGAKDQFTTPGPRHPRDRQQGQGQDRRGQGGPEGELRQEGVRRGGQEVLDRSDRERRWRPRRSD